jgi:hypothetical protein
VRDALKIAVVALGRVHAVITNHSFTDQSLIRTTRGCNALGGSSGLHL